jgi:hypothetical protein
MISTFEHVCSPSANRALAALATLLGKANVTPESVRASSCDERMALLVECGVRKDALAEDITERLLEVLRTKGTAT